MIEASVSRQNGRLVKVAVLVSLPDKIDRAVAKGYCSGDMLPLCTSVLRGINQGAVYLGHLVGPCDLVFVRAESEDGRANFSFDVRHLESNGEIIISRDPVIERNQG